MTFTQEKIEYVRTLLLKRYKSYWSMPASERFVLAVSVLIDDVKVREATGNNDGDWVKAILGATSLPEGYYWCAAAMAFCADVAKVWRPKSRAAAVSGWIDAAREEGRLLKTPKRGCFCAVKSDGLSHCGAVFSVNVNTKHSITSGEGNTSPGEKGSQQNGQGMYRRTRPLSFWDFYIKVD